MNDIRLNVKETPAAISRPCPQISHIHDALVAQFSMLGRRKDKMKVVRILMNIEKHGPSVATTSRQRLDGRQRKLPLMNCVQRSGH